MIPWPSWLRHGANNAGISGSIPLGIIFYYLFSLLLLVASNVHIRDRRPSCHVVIVVVLLRLSKYSLVLWLWINLSIPRHRLSYIYTYYYTLLLYDHCCECAPQNSSLDHNTFLFRTSIEMDITVIHISSLLNIVICIFFLSIFIQFKYVELSNFLEYSFIHLYIY